LIHSFPNVFLIQNEGFWKSRISPENILIIQKTWLFDKILEGFIFKYKAKYKVDTIGWVLAEVLESQHLDSQFWLLQGVVQSLHIQF